VRARNIRKIPEQAVDAGVFPVPPLPPKETTSKEKADA
jgi:NADH-quinone oxidoreductase subunit H